MVEAPSFELVGRETEMARLHQVLEAVEGSRSIVLQGGPGIGKTALWGWGLEVAAEAGIRVLTTRCVEVEIPLALTAIVDLLEVPFREVAGELSEPQRRALAVALGFEEPPEHPVEPIALARATLEVFRALSVRGPLVLAIDDVQWLDAASQRVLAFVVRRLADAPVVLLATLRTEAGSSDPLALKTAFGPSSFTGIELGGLTAGAIQHLVRTRLGVRIPRPLLARVHRASGGNPMFALELARSLPDPAASAGAPLPVPDSLRGVVRVRVASLPKELIPLTRLVAVLERPTLAQLGRALASEERAASLIDVGFVHAVLDVAPDGVVRFAHPLLASAVYAEIAPAERRRIQRQAAEVAEALAAAARCRGIAVLGAGEPAGAITLLERARIGFAAIGAPYELAHTQRTLGAAHARAGKRRRAAEALREAHRLFGELGTPAWQKRTDDELRRAYPRPRRDRDLTPAEEHVAALVAAGRTNREVAAQLFTTVKTVEAHLTRIYRKTGVRSRTELARRYANADRQ